MTEARPWLPDCCLTSGRSVAAVADIFARWSAHWFVTPPLTLGDRWVKRGGGQPVGASDWAAKISVGPGLAFQYRLEADTAIGQALLSLPAQRATPHGQDLQLLRIAGGAVLSDLEKRLTQLRRQPGDVAGASAAADDHSLFDLILSDSAGRPVARIMATAALLVEIVKYDVKPRRSLPSPVSPGEAVVTNQVECAARVGRARLTYSDLLDLSVGDVLILDADRNAPFDLMVDGQVACPQAIVPASVDSSLHFSQTQRQITQ